MIKKMIFFPLLGISVHISNVLADIAAELQMRLDKINSFYVNFIQKVITSDGNLIHEGKGQLWIKRPNLFKWHILSPDEIWLVSDGTNLWFYDTLVEQVTVISLSDAMINMPFMLLVNYSLQDWKLYHITQNGNDFFLRAIENKENLKDFSITIQPDGNIQEFIVIEDNGQMNSYQLQGMKNIQLDDDKFKFLLPPGIALDDQRSNRLQTN